MTLVEKQSAINALLEKAKTQVVEEVGTISPEAWTNLKNRCDHQGNVFRDNVTCTHVWCGVCGEVLQGFDTQNRCVGYQKWLKEVGLAK
jgi:hypothetical protein